MRQVMYKSSGDGDRQGLYWAFFLDQTCFERNFGDGQSAVAASGAVAICVDEDAAVRKLGVSYYFLSRRF